VHGAEHSANSDAVARESPAAGDPRGPAAKPPPAVPATPSLCRGSAPISRTMPLTGKGRPREAIDAYQRALVLAPSYTNAYVGLALAYDRLGEPEQALAYADKAMRLSPHDPTSAPLYVAKATAFGMLQDYQEALVWVQRAEAATLNIPINGFGQSALLAVWVERAMRAQ
jgi:tetratricopeptide (TPR) repeat protein